MKKRRMFPPPKFTEHIAARAKKKKNKAEAQKVIDAIYHAGYIEGYVNGYDEGIMDGLEDEGAIYGESEV